MSPQVATMSSLAKNHARIVCWWHHSGATNTRVVCSFLAFLRTDKIKLNGGKAYAIRFDQSIMKASLCTTLGSGLQLTYCFSWCVRREARRSVVQFLIRGAIIFSGILQSFRSRFTRDLVSASTLVLSGICCARRNRCLFSHQSQIAIARWRSCQQ